MEARKFIFKSVTMSDVPLLHEWLNRPHVADKWDGPCVLSEVEKQICTSIESGYIFPFIVELNGRPIGFLQSYNAARVGDGWWENEPLGTWGVDQYIAEENLLGKGIGSSFLKEFTDNLLTKPNVTRVITDPSPDNPQAIKAYEKAGFKKIGIIETPDGPALLMEKYLE